MRLTGETNGALRAPHEPAVHVGATRWVALGLGWVATRKGDPYVAARGPAGWPRIPELAATRRRATPPQADRDVRHYGLALFGIEGIPGYEDTRGRPFT